MPGLSTKFRVGECREVVFWLLLLGSWQFLASPGQKTGIIGAIGAAAFLVYAWANLDRLRGLGLDHARWRSTARANWVLAAVSGILAGSVVFVIGTTFRAKYETGRQLETYRAPGDSGARARGDRVPRLSVRVPDVVVEQSGQ